MIFIMFMIKNVDLGKKQPGSDEVEAFERVFHNKEAANAEDLQEKNVASNEVVPEKL